jgi:hypothetical protein
MNYNKDRNKIHKIHRAHNRDHKKVAIGDKRVQNRVHKRIYKRIRIKNKVNVSPSSAPVDEIGSANPS